MHAKRGLAQRVAIWSIAVALSAIGAGSRAQAQGAGQSYEQQRVSAALASSQLVRARAPEGKTIEFVRFERREVFEGDDLVVPVVLPKLAPRWPNQFHWLTEESIVRRELLLLEGEPYREALADESMRNLRELGAFSLVSIVAVETSDPTKVGVVVYTRDLWSLRLEQQLDGVGTTFTFGAALVERNFLGRNKTLSVRFGLDSFTYAVGETYLDPRMFGGDLRLYEALDVIVNRASGDAEGSSGTLLWGKPFHNLAQSFAFDVLAHYTVEVARRVSDGELLGFDTRSGENHGANCPPEAAQCVGRAWDDRRVKLEAGASYRIGEQYKTTFSVGAGFRDRVVGEASETRLLSSERAVFEREVLPQVRREAYPYAGYRLYMPRFETFTNLGTFGQTESVRLGPRLDARFALPLRAYGSSSDGFVTRGLIGYVWANDDALADAVVEGLSRLEGPRVVDEEVLLRVRAATPSFDWLAGRFVVRGLWDARRDDTQRTLVTLGGDSGLRGYPSQYFYGSGVSKLLANLEYRTQPLALQAVHLGLVAFYDAGSVYAQLSRARFHHSVGLGLRALFPHFNRQPFRLDFGVPLDSQGFAVTVSYGTAQAVALTPEEDALGTGLDLQ